MTALEKAFRDQAAAVARAVFAPDYYQGPWEVWLDEIGRRKVCSNYTTALAWANYARRRGLWCISLAKH